MTDYAAWAREAVVEGVRATDKEIMAIRIAKAQVYALLDIADALRSIE